MKNKDNKISILCDNWGIDPEDLVETIMDSTNPGICQNDDCDFSTDVEPDQAEGWCNECDTPSVESLSMMMGVI